jgi:hypothetical protein
MNFEFVITHRPQADEPLQQTLRDGVESWRRIALHPTTTPCATTASGLSLPAFTVYLPGA